MYALVVSLWKVGCFCLSLLILHYSGCIEPSPLMGEGWVRVILPPSSSLPPGEGECMGSW